MAGASAPRDPRLVVAVSCAAALGVLIEVLPLAGDGCCLTPDAIGYMATANSWIHGAGFVDPVLYSHYLPDVRPPVPAFAIRPPAVSVLAVLPLALQVSVGGVLIWHAVWAALVAAAAVLVASRSMSLPAATGFAVALSWAPGWSFVATRPLTEVTSVALLLAALAALRAGMGSVRGALLLAIITLVGWLVRPNLGLILPAVVLAVACERGPRAALRDRVLWVYVGAFAILHRAVAVGVEASTGFAPYAHYGVMAEIIETTEVYLYRKEYVGWLAYLEGNSGRVWVSIGSNIRASIDVLFSRDFYLWVGWPAIPALVFALWRDGVGSLERRFAAFAALGFTALALATYGGFNERRYLFLGAACA